MWVNNRPPFPPPQNAKTGIFQPNRERHKIAVSQWDHYAIVVVVFAYPAVNSHARGFVVMTIIIKKIIIILMA